MHKVIAYWVIFHAFLSSADFFHNQLFEKILSGIPSECQTVWTLIIWVKTVCQDYQQTPLVDKELIVSQSNLNVYRFHCN